jgi:hypothetical protein
MEPANFMSQAQSLPNVAFSDLTLGKAKWLLDDGFLPEQSPGLIANGEVVRSVGLQTWQAMIVCAVLQHH